MLEGEAWFWEVDPISGWLTGLDARVVAGAQPSAALSFGKRIQATFVGFDHAGVGVGACLAHMHIGGVEVTGASFRFAASSGYAYFK